MTEETKQADEIRNYAAEATTVLTSVGHGTLLYNIGEALAEIAESVRSNGKAGSLTLKLGMKAVSKGGGPAVNLSYELKVAKPKPETGETLMYSTEDGRLSRRHPDQPDLPGFGD